jgi:hypothetical protein
MTGKLDSPWSNLVAPKGDGEISATRVDPHSKWSFFWSLSHLGHPQLTLLHKERPKGKLPVFEGFRVTTTLSADGLHMLSFTLDDNASQEVFHSLCLDIVSAANKCEAENQAVKESVDRAWNWHRLLQGLRDARLTPNEQQGLMGELYIIYQAIGKTDPHTIVESWQAPEENAKDFINESQAIEVKAKRSAHSSTVRITSAEQLDTRDFHSVILAVVNIARDMPLGKNLHEFAQLITDQLAKSSRATSSLFEQKVVRRGLWPEHDYTDDLWSVTSVDFYAVATNFPRIQGSDLSPGIGKVTYDLEINAIKPFLIHEREALDATYSDRASNES